MNKRRVTFVLVAIIPVAILVGAIVATRGGSTHRPAKLPVAAGGSGSDAAATADEAAAPALYPSGGIVYEAGDALPALDGRGTAYRLPSTSVTDAKVRQLAAALGINGEPVDKDGGLTVEDGERVLTVYPQSGGSWSFFRTSGDASASSGVATASPACPPDAKCVEPDPGGGTVAVEPPAPERPADLPSDAEAKTIALDVLRAAGVDADGADVHVDDAFTQWSVRVDPVVDGMATSGLTTYLAIGSGGSVDYANGYLATPERADDYPLTGTAVAIERMNRGEGFGGGVRPLAADAAEGGATGDSVGGSGADPGVATATDTPAAIEPALPVEPSPMPPETVDPVDPSAPVLPVEPQHITLSGARQVLLFTPSVDGTEGWLVPAYAFTTDAGEGDGPVVMAVEGEFLQ